MGIITESFPASERGRAMSILATFVALGMMCGPVLGGMLELGDFAPELHAGVGREAAKAAELLLAYGPCSESYVQGAHEAGLAGAQAFATHDALVAALEETCRAGDTLLFKGSRGMRMERALALFLGEEVEA